MNKTNFWKELPKPIIGLAPMDGITDAAFRFVVDKIGSPSVLFTEFVPAEGLIRQPQKFANQLTAHKSKTPLVVQLFGNKPNSFQQAAVLLTKMNRFAGIDINMGCPARNLAQKEMGAGLIGNYALAKKIIEQTKKATILPVSVKTRLGDSKIETEDWIKNLLKAKPTAISLHGRTLKQLYSGGADWEEIGKAAKQVKQTKTVFLGNGDIKSRFEALEKIKKYGLDGVLIARGALGNPWVFTDQNVDYKVKLQTALLQCKIFMELTPKANFLNLRKHLLWYCRGFEKAAEVRLKLVKCKTFPEVANIINQCL